jgi:hypothetical protein
MNHKLPIKPWRDKMGRTISEISVPTDKVEATNFILNWLIRNDFEILERKSAGNVIEKSIKGFKIRLTTHPGSIVALHGGRLGLIVFEITIDHKENCCLVHGEFYSAGAGGGIVSYYGQELEVCEKPGLVGRLPRKKGFKLMNRFISDVEAEF